MALTWSKTFSSADDGSSLTGAQLGTLQSDIDSGAMQLVTTQTVTGTKVFSGAVSFTNKSVITCLSTTASVNMKAGAGPTTLYTVPAGKTAIITHVVVRTISASLSGGSSFSFTGWRQTVDLSAITSAFATSFICLDCNNAVYTPAVAASTFTITNTTGSTGDATATIDVFGYLFG